MAARRLCLALLLLVTISIAPAHANISEGAWIFHGPNGDETFKRAHSLRGTPYVCLPELMLRFSLKLRYDPSSFEMLLENPARGNFARFKTYSSDVELLFAKGAPATYIKKRRGLKLPEDLFTSVHTFLSRRPEFVGPSLCVPIEFGDRVLRPLLTGKTSETPLFVSDKRALESTQVILDPGHGGNDYGASAGGLREKDLVLAFANDLKNALTALGVRCLMTRESDVFVTLSERARMTNHSAAKLFLSLHMNASPQPELAGFEVYVLSLTKDDSGGRAAVAREQQFIPSDLPEGFEKAAADLRASANFERSLRWADMSRQYLKEQFKESSSRSVRMGPFYVLYAAQMPALLLELGYLSNTGDREKVFNPDTRRVLAEGLAQKIAASLNAKK
ncbi:MAG: N-acetylmuramoyl-L-alanine amidase [Bdellovibrionota bacterium]